MASIQDVETWRGQEVVDRGGERIGKLEEIYLDRHSGAPEFACVKTGLFGRRLTFVPLAEATPNEDAIQVPYEKDLVKDAPSVEPEGDLSAAEEADLYRHYGLEFSVSRVQEGAVASSELGVEGGSGDVDDERRLRRHRGADADPPDEEGEYAAAGVAGTAGAAGAAGDAAAGRHEARRDVGEQRASGRTDPSTGSDPADRERRATAESGPATAAGGSLGDVVDERIRAHTDTVMREANARIDGLEARVRAMEEELAAFKRGAA